MPYAKWNDVKPDLRPELGCRAGVRRHRRGQGHIEALLSLLSGSLMPNGTEAADL
jgi:hypothetical protein